MSTLIQKRSLTDFSLVGTYDTGNVITSINPPFTTTKSPVTQNPVVCTNLLSSPEDFTNAAWTKTGLTVDNTSTDFPLPTGDGFIQTITTADSITGSMTQTIDYTYDSTACYELSVFVVSASNVGLLNIGVGDGTSLGYVGFDVGVGLTGQPNPMLWQANTGVGGSMYKRVQYHFKDGLSVMRYSCIFYKDIFSLAGFIPTLVYIDYWEEFNSPLGIWGTKFAKLNHPNDYVDSYQNVAGTWTGLNGW